MACKKCICIHDLLISVFITLFGGKERRNEDFHNFLFGLLIAERKSCDERK